MMNFRKATLLAGVVAWALAGSVQAVPLFTAQAGPGGSQTSCSPGTPGEDNSNSPVPVTASHACSDSIGATGAQAASNFGSVGARTSAQTFSTVTVPRQTSAKGRFDDTLVFSKTDPSLPDQFNVSLNLALDGIVNAGSGSFPGNGQGSVEIDVFFISQHALDFNYNSVDGFEMQNTGGFAGTGGIVHGASGFSTLLVTPQQLASVGDIPLVISLATFASALGAGASGLADFLNTLELPTGIDVFNLPDGYTVNAGPYLINHRFVDPSGPGVVPEPPTVVLLALGILLMAARARGGRRSRSTSRSTASPD